MKLCAFVPLWQKQEITMQGVINASIFYKSLRILTNMEIGGFILIRKAKMKFVGYFDVCLIQPEFVR